VATWGVEPEPKRLELLHEAILTQRSSARSSIRPVVMPRILSRDLRAAARTLGLGLHVLNVGTDSGFDNPAELSTALAAHTMLGANR
jgi:hypothetical protein